MTRFSLAWLTASTLGASALLGTTALLGTPALPTIHTALRVSNPGISDQEEEIEALEELIQRTGINFIHIKNLNIALLVHS